MRHQDKVVSVAGRVLTAGASCRLLGQLQEVGRTHGRGRQTVFRECLHVWERLRGTEDESESEGGGGGGGV